MLNAGEDDVLQRVCLRGILVEGDGNDKPRALELRVVEAGVRLEEGRPGLFWMRAEEGQQGQEV